MTNLQAAFEELLVSPAKLAQCVQTASVSELLTLLKNWWHREHVSDESLLEELNICNRQPLDLNPWALASRWLPYRYHAATRTISWCLPQGRPTEPFFDQFIERCRRLSANQFLQPKTALAPLLIKTNSQPTSAPAGFIFHISRCGSTLVSGCLAELENTGVYSEPPLLTEVLLDTNLTGDERRKFLGVLLDLQTRWLPAPNAVVVKWNAWDLFHWPLIRALYPQVPVLLLIRNPVEVLASHRHLSGRHMAGDPSLAGLNPAFAGMRAHESPLDFRIRVLYSLFEAMNGICEEPGVMTVDYAQLSTEEILAISRHFGIRIENEDYLRIQQRMQFHSKEPNREFWPDSLEKRQQFSAPERDKIDQNLNPLYERLLRFTSLQLTGAVAC